MSGRSREPHATNARSRALWWAGLALLLGAAVAMLAPTYPQTFLGVVPTETIVHYASWLDPLMLFYGNPFPLVAAALLASSLLAHALMARSDPQRRLPWILACAATVSCLSGLELPGVYTPVTISAPALLALATVVVALAHRSRRRPAGADVQIAERSRTTSSPREV